MNSAQASSFLKSISESTCSSFWFHEFIQFFIYKHHSVQICDWVWMWCTLLAQSWVWLSFQMWILLVGRAEWCGGCCETWPAELHRTWRDAGRGCVRRVLGVWGEGCEERRVLRVEFNLRVDENFELWWVWKAMCSKCDVTCGMFGFDLNTLYFIVWRDFIIVDRITHNFGKYILCIKNQFYPLKIGLRTQNFAF